MNQSWIEKNLTAVPVANVTEPKTGRVAMANYWWLEKDGHVFRTKRGMSFQCNPDRRVVEKVYQSALSDGGFTAIMIPVAYVPERR